jgi:DNA-binding NarL/FixJ family response regulator
MSIKISIADDNPAIRKTLRLCIESNTDWQVCGEAENGEVAVALVQQQNPDLLILDLSMPVMNGLDAARKIAVIAPKTGIVLFTNYAGEELQGLAKSVGIGAVVSKDASGGLLHLLAVLKEVAHASRAA